MCALGVYPMHVLHMSIFMYNKCVADTYAIHLLYTYVVQVGHNCMRNLLYISGD